TLTPDLVAGQDRRQEPLALLLGPVRDYGGAAHREREHVRHRRRPRAHHLLVEDRLLDERGAATSVLLGPRHAGPAGVVQLALPGEAELECGLVAGGLAPGVVGRKPFPPRR